MGISIKVFSNRIYKTHGSSSSGTYTKGTFIMIGSKDKDGNENYGVLDYYLVQGFKIGLIGEDESYIRRMKNIKITVESKDGNEVNVCGVKTITIEKINGGYYTNIIPVICTKIKKDYLNCGANSKETFKYQEIVFELSYDIKEDGVDKSYRIESDKLKFVTGKLNKENSTQPLMNAMEIPTFYRPFYFNAVLLLFPQNFDINNETHACEFNEKVVNARVTRQDDIEYDEKGNIVEKEMYEDSKYCHGRLFYSIANGISLSEDMKYEGYSNTKKVNYLNKVVLDINQGEYNLTIKKPFRFYDELDCVYSDKGNNAVCDTYSEVKPLTKLVSFGITEPFNVEKNKNKAFRDGIPLHWYNDENEVHPLLRKYNKSTLKFNNEKMSSSLYENRGYNNKIHYFPMDVSPSLSFQSIGDWLNADSREYFIDTTKILSLSFSVTDSTPHGYENEANTISLNYNGIKFYDEIIQSIGGDYTVKGNSSVGVRYYLLMSDKEPVHDAPNGEFDNIMRSIYDFSVCDTGKGYSSPKIRYSGLHTNDYITEKSSNKYIASYNGWQGMYTKIKMMNGNRGVCLFGNNNHECIDITAILKRCEGGQTIKHICGNWRPIIIGVYDTYTSLSEDKYNETKNPDSRSKYIKLHTNRFSVIKVYKVNYKEN